MLQQPAYSSSAATQAAGHLERGADASAAEPSTYKQEGKVSVHALLDDKEMSVTRE